MTTITDLIHTLEASKSTGEPIVLDPETFTAVCKFMTMIGTSEASASLANFPILPEAEITLTEPDPLQLITFKAAMKRIGCSRASLTRLRKRDDTFPKPVVLSSRSKRFFAAEIDLWLSQQQNGSR